MESKELISILLPVYNVVRFIEECVESILNQTYDNWELIIYDDGSEDGTFEFLLGRYGKIDRIQIFRGSQNRGIAYALNACFARSKGAYIARCDGDDVMVEDRLEVQLNYLIRNRSVDLVGNSFDLIDEGGKYIRSRFFESGPNQLIRLANYTSPVSHIWLARRTVYETVGPYRLSSVEDYDFLLRSINCGFRLDNIPGYIGMRIRVRDGNTVSRYGLVQRLLFNYAQELYKHPELAYSKEREVELIELGKFGTFSRLHYISDLLSSLSAKSRLLIVRIILMISSALFSPWKMQYYYRQFKVMFLVGLNGKNNTPYS